MTHPIYLDYNGTTPLDPEVYTAMWPFFETEFGNPSSSHWYGIKPRQAVEAARRQVAALLACQPEEVFFTSGGTESNNHAIKGMARALKNRGRHIVTSTIEHPAVLEVCSYLQGEGFAITFVDVDSQGMLDPEWIRQALRPDTILVSVMHANNEVGTVQPIAAIAELARTRGIAIHTDAAQSLGKIPADVQMLGVDLLSVAGHKLYAPKGIGALYLRKGLTPEKFCHGAGQEKGWRAGTENVAGIVGLGKACEIAGRDLATSMTRMQDLRDQLHKGIAARVADVRLNGHPDHRLPNTLSLSFRGIEADRLLEEIGLDVAASAGAACHSGTVAISHVLAAMQVPADWAQGTLRFSIGRMTTVAEIERAADVVGAAVARLRKVGGII
ncbi:cysteine desulfurase [Desulfoprunum benzoelyticum]|uniref:cysteine desulfurase n=1 Tax=Desulfoprunum benzoelyticum TaxID=1506996 RepID=A0A840UUI2_9BACT|nr:cysteine desulfurase family protein [Desulfoprunum benzoelyticum]MBB5347054.1 cysteine desulfurase [Desulfoprunum benzoelyticum]MBM9529748.1 cysteine desulfurase [Desulfoprunum benzoelyticum]